MAEIRAAQPWMIHALYGRALEHTVEAIVATEGDTVLGMAALYPENGRLVLVARITPPARAEIRKHRRTLILAAREIMRRAARWRLPVLTIADPAIPGSAMLVEHLGFTQTHKDIYEWTSAA